MSWYILTLTQTLPVACSFALRTSPLAPRRAHVCGEAGNGKQAIEKVKELNPDILLLDPVVLLTV